MTGNEFNSLFQRELSILSTKIDTYHEEDLWIKVNQIPNTAGNLCLHICGNLQHFIGHMIGGTDYERRRDAEFNATGVSKSDMLQEIQTTKKVIEQVLSVVTDEKLREPFPMKYQEEEFTNEKWLLHLYGHMDYHLGQIDYHRRGIIGD